MNTISLKFFAEAQKYIPGGVNSPVRAFKAVGGSPLFMTRGVGSKIYDVDGNSYIDYVGSWGPLILGHAHPRVIEAIKETAAKGVTFGSPTSLETELACLIVEAVPSVEMVRMVNSGTEAVISALRLARAYTGRHKIIKFAGCYHGHGDSLLIKAGSGVTTLGLPDSPGVTPGTAQDTIIAPYNNLDYLKNLFAKKGEEIATVIVEPVAGNMGLVLPQPGFLEGLRQLTKEYGALLIFDEVMTGFRVAYGGAQEYFNIDPDLTVLGKIIGGGLPVGAYAGKRKIMDQVAPAGAVYQAGTLSGNPLAMAAGIETLLLLRQPKVYDDLTAKTAKLLQGLKSVAQEVNISAQSIGAMFGVFFTETEVSNFTDVTQSDLKSFEIYFRVLLENGIYVAPSQFESCFMSLAHSDKDIEETIFASEKAFTEVKRCRRAKQA